MASDFKNRILTLVQSRENSVFAFLIVFLAAMAIFGAIMFFQKPKSSLEISDLELNQIQATQASISLTIVGNKNSKIFHLQDCPGALKMNEANKVFFESYSAAVSAGFRPAKNCPQLEYVK